MLKKFLLISAMFIVFLGCDKQKFPVEPSIEFISIAPALVNETRGDSILITIGFEDGDGDLGSNDTTFQDLFYHIMRANAFDTLLGLRLPFIDTAGSSNAISGEIELIFDSFFLVQPPFSSDTIHYEIYVKDRAGHQSNTVVTDKIIVER